MYQISKLLLDLAVEESEDSSNILHHLLSDMPSMNIQRVVDTNTTPIEYARHITNHSASKTAKLLWGETVSSKGLATFERIAVFEVILINAMLVRMTSLRPRRLEDSLDVILNANMFILNLEENSSDYSGFCGIGYYSVLSNLFKELKYKTFYCGNIPLLEKVIKAVSNAEQDDWILYDKLWYNAFLSSPEKLLSFRRFLYAATIHYSIPDNAVESMFEVERKFLFSTMEEFVDLRESSKTTKADISSFLHHLTLYFFESFGNNFLQTLGSSPYPDLKMLHHSVFEQQFDV